MMLVPIISIILGLVYIIKPGIFKLGFKRSATTSSKRNLIYVQLLGVLFLGAGVWSTIERLT
jgi:hypothetical protein